MDSLHLGHDAKHFTFKCLVKRHKGIECLVDKIMDDANYTVLQIRHRYPGMQSIKGTLSAQLVEGLTILASILLGPVDV